MKLRLISKILGTGLILFSFIQIIPTLISLIYAENNLYSFFQSALITFFTGLFLFGVNYSKDYEDLKIRDGFLLIVLLWFVFSILWVILVYSPVAHWVWGGGFLADLGELDFAGGTVIHVNAGVSGLVLVYLLGNRAGYKNTSVRPAKS